MLSRQAVVFGLVLALVLGRDALQGGAADASAPAAAPAALDADAGRSAGLRVHIAYCTS